MMLSSSSYLGIAVSDRVWRIAEVALSGDQPTITHLASFVPPAEATLEKPEAMGRALGAFLKQSGIRSSRAVFGVPARWLVAVDRETPPAGLEEAKAVLRLAAERITAAESQEFIFDYSGELASGRAGRVLLVGMLRHWLERIAKVCDVAGLDLEAVTASSLALAQVAGAEEGVVVLEDGRAELVWRTEGTPRMLRHMSLAPLLPGGDPPVGPLGAELKRAVALAPTNGSTGRHLVLWDGVGLSASHLSDLNQRVGASLRLGEGPSMLGIAQGHARSEDIGACATALALALGAWKRERLPLDFARPRLAPPRQARISLPVKLGIAVAVLFLGWLGWLYYDVRQLRGQRDELRAQLATQAKEVAAKKLELQQYDYVRPYFAEGRANLLRFLVDLTQAVGDASQIFITSIALKENDARTAIIATIQGKAQDSTFILNVEQALQKNPRISNVQRRETVAISSGRMQEQRFTTVFQYSLLEVAAPAPARQGVAATPARVVTPVAGTVAGKDQNP